MAEGMTRVARQSDWKEFQVHLPCAYTCILLHLHPSTMQTKEGQRDGDEQYRTETREEDIE